MNPKIDILRHYGGMVPDIEEDDASEGELKTKLLLEEEDLITDILLEELRQADHIDIDTENTQVRKEIKDISHDLVDIAEIW